MSLLERFFAWIGQIGVRAERERREAYLAASANRFELEQRMRALDRMGSSVMRVH